MHSKSIFCVWLVLLATCASPVARNGLPTLVAPNIRPAYPEELRLNNEQGAVELKVFIRKDGTANPVWLQPELLTSSGLPDFDSTVRQAIEKAQPYRVDGVTAWPAHFELRSYPHQKIGS